MAADDHDFVLLNANDVQDFNDEGILPLSTAELVEVQTWLAPTEYAALSGEYRKHRTSHLAGTGTWILDTKEYQQWYGSGSGALWIKAVAGAGKSVIAASLVSKLATDEKVPVLYFFFRHIVSANQRPQSLIRDYLSQVLEYCPLLQKQLVDLVQKRRALESVSFDDMWRMLVSALERLPRVYCVIDALDEMDQGNDFFLHHLVALAQQRSGNIKLLLTSRPVPRVEAILRDSRIVPITLQPQSVDPDISAYVQHRLQGCNASVEAQSLVHRTMCAKANGHFLYARLMMDDLLDPSKNLMTSEQNLVTALDGLPQPMAGMYTQMLLEHARRSGVAQELQILLLQWVTRVERPIRLLELSAMLEARQRASGTSERTKSVVREGCGPLLELLDDETVCPIHHSFTEYLYDQDRNATDLSVLTFPLLNYHEAQRTLSLTCLEYLCSGWHHKWHSKELNAKCRNAGVVDNEQKRKEMKLSHPFLEYAMDHWDKHAVKSGFSDVILMSELDALLVNDERLLSAWLEITAPPRDVFSRTIRKVREIWTPLHVAADKGLGFYITHLVANGQEVDCLDGDGYAPLSLAAHNGHSNTVAALLQAKAKNDEPDEVGLKPLHHAANRNHHEVVKLLLEVGVDPLTPKTKENPGRWCGNSPSTYGDTPLMYACRNGHVETVRAFIPFLTKDNLHQALCWALGSGQSKAAMTLLNAPGINPNGFDKQPRPIFLACSVRDVEAMRLLLDMGADLSTSESLSSPFADFHGYQLSNLGGSTPLHAFAKAERVTRDPIRSNSTELNNSCLKEGIKILLNAGIDADAIDPQGFTALHHIVRPGNQFGRQESSDGIQDGLKLLLERGARPTILTKDGSNVLHLAGALPVAAVDILIDHGVNIDQVRQSDGQTPLMSALDKNNTVLAKHLLSRGADPNVTDQKGNTLLHTLAEKSDFQLDMDMLRSLVAAGADIKARNRDGDTIMHMRELKPKLLTFALENGFDLEAKNRQGHSVLFHHISHYASGKLCQTIVDAGSSVFTRDAQGCTVLHGLLTGGFKTSEPKTTDMMRYFAQCGVNPLIVDNLGNTLWHKVAERASSYAWKEQCAIMDLLTEWKVPALTKNYQGRSPLHILCSVTGDGGSEQMIRYLVEKVSADINEADDDMIRPIHLAASWNIALACLLLDLDANPTFVTLEGQTPLMIACRNRQCNTVCMLLDHYKTHQQISIVNNVDIKGRTALHYACQSGRPETVGMLLNAGADPNIEDKQGHTPLRMCADYLIEQALWSREHPSKQLFSRTNSQNKAVNVLLEDDLRPDTRQEIFNPIRVRESIRMLMRHGADMSWLTSLPGISYMGHYHLPLVAAIRHNCPAMVSELFSILDELLQDQVSSEAGGESVEATGNPPRYSADKIKRYWRSLLDPYEIKTKSFLPAMDSMREIVAENIGETERTLRFLRQLLEDDNEFGVIVASELGARFIDLDNSGDNPLFQMVTWGFTDLLRKVGQDVSKMTVAWTKEMAPLNVNWRTDRLRSVMHVALSRQLPNLEMVKTLVSEYKLDIHEQFISSSYEGITQSYIHLVAKPFYWWQTEALEFLLDAGADVESRNSNEETPLMVALQNHHGASISYAALRSVTILLQHGANPNVVDKGGQTCLNIAIGQPKLIKLLLQHGADPMFGNRPLLFDAIKMQDTDTLKSIIDAKIDVNVLALPVTTGTQVRTRRDQDDSDDENTTPKSWADIRSVDELVQCAYPLHIAAFVYPSQVEARTKATEMVKLLLKAGADPFKAYEDGTRVIHALAEGGHIVKPLIEYPNFNMETRDGRGRTVLLAACDANPNQDSVAVTELPSFLLEHGASPVAADSEGRNALHCLISAHESWFWTLKIPLQLQSMAPALVSQPDCQGRTPFHYALEKLRFDFIDPFLSYGTDPLIVDPIDGTIALHHLARDLANDYDMILHNRSEMMHIIQKEISFERFPFTFPLEKPPNELEEDDLFSRPGDEARAQLRSPRRHFLSFLERGLSIEARDHAGETPLFKVMSTGFYKYTVPNTEQYIVLRLFEDAGAEFKARNNIGQSLLHKLATRVTPKDMFGSRTDENAEEALKKAFQWLVKKGLNVSWEDECGRTCLDVAAAMGSQWVLDMYKRK